MRRDHLPWWQTRLDLIGRLGDEARRERWYDEVAELVRDDEAGQTTLLTQMWSMNAVDRVSVQLDRAALFLRLGKLDDARAALESAAVGPSCQDEALVARARTIEARIAGSATKPAGE